MDILERSYSKQLKDAREIADAAERSREELAVRVAKLDQARKDSIELLAAAQTEIDGLTADRDQLRRQLDGWTADPAEADSAVDLDAGTINTLLDDDSWLRRKAPEREKQAQKEAAREAAAEEERASDMIDPALVFSGRASRD